MGLFIPLFLPIDSRSSFPDSLSFKVQDIIFTTFDASLYADDASWYGAASTPPPPEERDARVAASRSREERLVCYFKSEAANIDAVLGAGVLVRALKTT
jgi:hypothetical protein